MLALETRIALRYLRAKKRSGFMSFIGLISVIGIAIGVIALIVVLSVMNGFQKDIRGQLLRVSSHMEMGYYQAMAPNAWQTLAAVAKENPHVLGVSPFVTGQALLASGGDVRGVQIKGIAPEYYGQVSEFGAVLPKSLYSQLKPQQFGLILGQDLANALHVQVGQKVTVITPEGNVTPVGMVPRMKQFQVIGTIKTGIFAVDNTLALTHLKDAQTLYRVGGVSPLLQLRLDKPEEAPMINATILPPDLRQEVWVNDWTYQNKDYFQAVEVEKKMMFIIMFFISLVASINLISTLMMTVTEKQSAIAILRTLGLPAGSIMRIFMIQGTILGFIGTFIGTVIGVILALNVGKIVHGIELIVGRKLISSSIYFLDYVPSHVLVSDVAIITAISLILSFTVTLYPSKKAAHMQPAEALRYE